MQKDIFWILLSKKICGEANVNELAQLEDLIRDDYELGAVAERMQQIWTASENASFPSISAEEAYNKITASLDFNDQAEEPALIKRDFRKIYISIASVILLLLAITITYKFQTKTNRTLAIKEEANNSEIVMSPGSKTKIQLPDGTSVWVNACSKIKYAGGLHDKKREVYLEGEAYFEVKRDPSRPFIVHTSGIDIRVLGTGFNVKAYASEPTIEATLIHGSIEVINQNQPTATHVLLKPHEKLIYTKTKEFTETQKQDKRSLTKDFVINIAPISSIKPISDIKETSWIYDKLIFEDERLEDLAIRLERWYGVHITIETPKMKDYRISGTFVNETLEEALKELQMLTPFSYELKNKDIIIN